MCAAARNSCAILAQFSAPRLRKSLTVAPMRALSQVLDAMDYGGGSPIEWLEGWLPAMDSWQGWALLITVLVLGNEALLLGLNAAAVAIWGESAGTASSSSKED
jgi:hypothetical protein